MPDYKIVGGMQKDNSTYTVVYQLPNGKHGKRDIPINQYTGNPDAYKTGADFHVEDDTTQSSGTAAKPKPKTKTTSTSSGTTDFSLDVPAEFKKFFKVQPSKKSKGIVYAPKDATVQEKEAFRDWLNEQDAYDKVIQNSTEGFKVAGMDNLFYGGLGPEDFEYEYYKGRYGKDAADKAFSTPQGKQEARNLYLRELGLDKWADQNPSTDIYNDPQFREEYLEAYKTVVPEDKFRLLADENGQLGKFGFDHYDDDPWKKERKLPEVTGEDTELECDESVPCTDSTMTRNPKTCECECPSGMKINPETGKCESPVPGATKEPEDPGKFFSPDMANLAAAWADQITPRYPRLSKVNLDPGEVAYQDYATMVANQKGNQEKMLEFIENNVGGGPGVALAVNAMADSLDKTTDIIAGVQRENIGTYNQYERQRAGIENQEKMLNEKALSNYVDQVNTVNQFVEDEQDAKRANIAKMFGQMWENEANVSALEQAFPNAPKKSRRDASAFTEGVGRNPYLAVKGFDSYLPAYAAGPNAAGNYDLASQVEQLEDKGWDRADALKLVEAQAKMTGANRRIQNPYARRRQKMGGSTPFGVFLQGGIFE